MWTKDSRSEGEKYTPASCEAATTGETDGFGTACVIHGLRLLVDQQVWLSPLLRMTPKSSVYEIGARVLVDRLSIYP